MASGLGGWAHDEDEGGRQQGGEREAVEADVDRPRALLDPAEGDRRCPAAEVTQRINQRDAGGGDAGVEIMLGDGPEERGG